MEICSFVENRDLPAAAREALCEVGRACSGGTRERLAAGNL
jgi:hypothetical protein